jgi:hypothetical protein
LFANASIATPLSDETDQTATNRQSERQMERTMTQQLLEEGRSTYVVILEGSPLGTPIARTFDSLNDAEPFLLDRIRVNVPVNLRDRLERALTERIVSEDGVAAVSEVIAGKLVFLRAVTAAYAQRITIVLRRADEEEDARR